MRYPAHLVGGFTVGIATNRYMIQHLPIIDNQELSTIMISTLFIAGSVLGSLLPDIDHRGSYLGRRLPILSFLTNVTMGHRGATHAPFITIALAISPALAIHHFLSGTIQLFCLTILAGIMMGSFSHIFLDALTKSGIPLLYPFSQKHYRLAQIKTGGIGETITTIIMIVLIIWMSTGNMVNEFKTILR
jgi:inner membrane protein